MGIYKAKKALTISTFGCIIISLITSNVRNIKHGGDIMNTTELDFFIELIDKLNDNDWQRLLNLIKGK